MSMQLFVIYNSITLDFMDNGYMVMDGFFPETPDEGAETVTDQFMLHIRGSSAADLRSKIAAVSLMLEHARDHKNDAKAAWLFYSVDDPPDPGGTIPEWMSKIINGFVLYDKNLVRNWKQNKAVITVVIEHESYWDSSIETQVPLTNGNGTRNLTGLTVYNHHDGDAGHDNFVSIEAADILGDMPGRTRLEITNNYNVSYRTTKIWIGQNWTDPDNFEHIIEGESSPYGTEGIASDCSNGKYRYYNLPSGLEWNIFKWTLTNTFLNACQGKYYKVIARFYSSVPTQVKLRMKLQYEVTDVWESGQVTLSSAGSIIRDLFTFKLSPWLEGQTDLNQLDIIMTGQQNTGNPITVGLDFLQITPLDNYRLLYTTGYGIAYLERAIDDGINKTLYIDNGAGANKAGYLVGYGNPVTLYPGKNQKLYFLMQADVFETAEIARTISVKLFYRERRRAV